MKDYVLCNASATIRLALDDMDVAGVSVVMVLGSDGTLLGLATDGDFRRFLLADGSLDDPVLKAARTDYFWLDEFAKDSSIRNALSQYEVIPLIRSSTKELMDVATRSRLHQIPVLEPNLDKSDLQAIIEVFDSGWISSKSPAVYAFENAFEEHTGLRNCLAVSNGTVAIELALRSFGIGIGDEVIVPDLTFAATINAVINVGAVPVIVDISKDNLALNLDLTRRAISPSTKAIILVHLYGHPADGQSFRALCDANGIYLIEDCAEALGTVDGNAHAGALSDAATFSFFANKLITTGEGGIVAYKDESANSVARKIRDHGQSDSKRYWHDTVGSNFRMTGMQAALGASQIKKIKPFLTKKREIAKWYREASIKFGLEKVLQFYEHDGSSYWLNVATIWGANNESIDKIMQSLMGRGIECRPVFFPLSQMPPYRNFKFVFEAGDPVSAIVQSTAIGFPSSTTLHQVDIEHVVQELAKVLSESGQNVP